MYAAKLLLSDDIFAKLDIVDNKNERFQVNQLEREKQVCTEKGNMLIAIGRLTVTGAVDNAYWLITIRNVDETRMESHRVTSLKELCTIANEWGMKLHYERQKVEC